MVNKAVLCGRCAKYPRQLADGEAHVYERETFFVQGYNFCRILQSL